MTKRNLDNMLLDFTLGVLVGSLLAVTVFQSRDIRELDARSDINACLHRVTITASYVGSESDRMAYRQGIRRHILECLDRYE